jgi:hypothetical protein
MKKVTAGVRSVPFWGYGIRISSKMYLICYGSTPTEKTWTERKLRGFDKKNVQIKNVLKVRKNWNPDPDPIRIRIQQNT